MPSSSSADRAEITRKIVQQAKPRSVVQVGAGEMESTLALCDALDGEAGVMLTLVEPEIYSSADCRAVLDALEHHGHDGSVEMVANAADQALPDFFFQEQVYDLAVLNPLANADQNFVVMYFLGKLLPKGAMLLVHNAGSETVKPWLRRLVVAGDYRVKRQGPVRAEPPLLEKILRSRYQKLPALVRNAVEDMVRPEVITPDSQLGLNSEFLVLEKLCQGSTVELDVEQMIAELA